MDLSTKYLGLNLKNPVVVSASPLSQNVDTVKAIEDFGAAAVVLHSLFEEQITLEDEALDYYLTSGSESYAEAINYFPKNNQFKLGPEEYLNHIAKLKKSANIPIIASLNGVSVGGWMKYAKLIEDAGADALELNIYYIPTDPNIPGSQVEQIYLNDLSAVKENIKIPVAMKLSPYFSSLSNIAKRLDEGGVDGLVLFNRFYQPDIDLEKLEVAHTLTLSSNWEMRLPLRWIAILYGKIKASLALSGGVQNHEDVIKALMSGADVAMICSELLRNGVGRIREIVNGVEKWMQEREYDSIEQMKGSMSQKSIAEPAAYVRANYMKMLLNYKAK